MDDIDAALGAGGALASVLPGFQPRAGQLELARAIEEAIRTGQLLVAEAGTGIGKTFAYLVPALQSGARVLVSTGTRHLQDQIFHTDIPRLADALGVPVRAELLKGRANYLCRQRLGQTTPQDEAEAQRLHAVRTWSGQTRSGDIAELSGLTERDPLRPRITSTAENCLGNQCPEYEDCFVVRARSRAQQADLVVVNHHLLCADLALKDDGFGELLPEMDAIVIDEAHQFPAVLAQFFGFGVSARQCRDLGRDILAAAELFGDVPKLKDAAAQLGDAVQALQAEFPFSQQRLDVDEVQDNPAFMAAVDGMAGALMRLDQELEPQAQRGPEMANVWRRVGVLHDRLLRWQATEPDQLVRWAERQTGGFGLQAIPMDVAPAMDLARSRHPGSWILTSATLAVAGRFGHFLDRLGLQDAETLQVDSPFDYANHARLLLPPDLPSPNERGYARALLDYVLPLIDAAQGGCFFLCTSLRAVEEYAYHLQRRCAWPVLQQGSRERSHLLQAFRDDGHAVLVGTASFWEGVDVRGSALRLVIIDRLPFASPEDPMVKARSSFLQEQGRNPFFEYQVPQAVLTLKQGAGRLIRDVDDRGVLVLGDARAQRMRYGRQFLDSLPPMRVSQDAGEIRRFLEELVP